MYEVNEHEKSLRALSDNLKENVENNELEGIITIKLYKNKETEIEIVWGRTTLYEWVGILDFAQDTIKNAGERLWEG